MAVETYETRYGPIYRLVGGCKDDWQNIDVSKWYRKPSGIIRWRRRRVYLRMQRPALKAFKDAESRVGHEITVTGTLRTCALQQELYARDSNRYAPPSVGVHTQGLAVDVSTDQPDFGTKIHKALIACQFKQARPDEDWHYSMYVTA